MPGVLKNAIDVASRPWGQSAWGNKPTGLVSVSMGGMGGIRAQMSLRQSAVFLKLNIYPGDELCVSDAAGKFDKSGLSDEKNSREIGHMA
jgi:chromate reductase